MSGQHNPGPLKAEEVSHQQYRIDNESNRPRDGRWDDIYVNFSGFFGSYGPHVFAVAPELLALLIESQSSIGGDWRERRDALIAKATASTTDAGVVG